MPSGSKTKLWLGFGIMAAGVLVWVIWIRLAVAPAMSISEMTPGAAPEELSKAMDRMRPGAMMTSMLVGYGLSGLVFVGGMIVTAMGLIDYAAEVRRTSSS